MQNELKSYSISLETSQTIINAKLKIAKIIQSPHTDFYLRTRSRYLNESKTLSLYHIHNNLIIITFRIKGGSDLFEDKVSATSPINNIHRPFFG